MWKGTEVVIDSTDLGTMVLKAKWAGALMNSSVLAASDWLQSCRWVELGSVPKRAGSWQAAY